MEIESEKRRRRDEVRVVGDSEDEMTALDSHRVRQLYSVGEIIRV